MHYDDHIGLWERELRDWLPPSIFDAHLHVGLPTACGPLSPERRRSALATYTSFSLEELCKTTRCLYAGKRMAGWFAFPFPQREVALAPANRYIIEASRRERRLRPFLLADPVDSAPVEKAFAQARQRGVTIAGVKPYADRLGKDNFDAKMAEFLPERLLQFMNEHGLMMMLHTSGRGVTERDVQETLVRIAHTYPRIRVILAHLGRYLHHQDLIAFVDSGILQDHPSLYLETSSATEPAAYRKLLTVPQLRERILFGSDLPFGLITGVERWSETHGAIFLSRDTYSWSDPAMNEAFSEERASLTHNTYHVIKALKTAIEDLRLDVRETDQLKTRIFCSNAQALRAEE